MIVIKLRCIHLHPCGDTTQDKGRSPVILNTVFGFQSINQSAELLCNHPRHRRLRPRLPFPPGLVHKYERQNDVVQNGHSRRLDVDSRLLFVSEVVWTVELSNHRLLIGGHQLHPVV